MVRQAGQHEVWIVLNSRFPETLLSLREAFRDLVPPERVVTFHVPGPTRENDPAYAWRARVAERIRESFLAGLEPDFVHVSSLVEGLIDDAVTSVGLLENGFGSAITLYDLIPLVFEDQYLKDPPTRGWYCRKLQGLKNADLLLAISDQTRRDAMARLHIPEERIHTIYGAADDRFRRLLPGETDIHQVHGEYGLNKPFVLYTGGIDFRKNIEGLICAYAALPKALRTKHQLVIVCSV